MDLDLLRDSLGNVVASIDPGNIDGWYQLQYSVLFDLNGLEIEHLLLWNNLDDLAYDPQGYLVYDFEKERYFKFNFTFNFLELDEVFYVDTLVEYYSFDGTLLHTLEFDGAFDVYSLFENEFGQFVIGGKTVNVASIEGEDRLVDMGFTIYLFDENLNAPSGGYLGERDCSRKNQANDLSEIRSAEDRINKYLISRDCP